MFKEWNTTGTFLWIYGKRTHFFRFLFYVCPDYRFSHNVIAGAGKSILWYVTYEKFHATHSNNQSAPALLKKSKAYVIWDWH
jgi:hypothetical protein